MNKKLLFWKHYPYKILFKGVCMQNSKLKNSIILRGMASNVVDEAIVILKPNVKIKKMEHSKNTNTNEKSSSKTFIIKEAENVILDYIYKINENEIIRDKQKMESKIKFLKIINILFFILLIISIII